jgi:hypothetical protein
MFLFPAATRASLHLHGFGKFPRLHVFETANERLIFGIYACFECGSRQGGSHVGCVALSSRVTYGAGRSRRHPPDSRQAPSTKPFHSDFWTFRDCWYIYRLIFEIFPESSSLSPQPFPLHRLLSLALPFHRLWSLAYVCTHSFLLPLRRSCLRYVPSRACVPIHRRAVRLLLGVLVRTW